MSKNKKIIPCVYLKDGKLVKGFKNSEVISEEPVSYIVALAVKGADSIIIFDLSDKDAEHESALLEIRKITEAIDVPVIGAGNVKRLEDVKKLIYSGCKFVALNMAKQSNIELIEEAGKRFSKQGILACADSQEQILDNLKVLKENVCACILLNKLFIKGFEEIDLIPVINSDDSMENILSEKGVCGISGDIVNEIQGDYYTIKEELYKKGIVTEVVSPLLSWDDLNKNGDGLVPVVTQDIVTSEVLMLAYMNEEAFNNTVREGIMTYYSRSRKCLWKKGDTSGHYQYVKSLTADCDNDTLLAKVVQIGSACHTGARSCFFNEVMKKDYKYVNPNTVLEEVMKVIEDRKENPKEGSYTNYLFDKGIDKILKKVGEEATEIVIAAKNPEAEETKYEIADLLYHVMVLMAVKGLSWDDVMTELANR